MHQIRVDTFGQGVSLFDHGDILAMEVPFSQSHVDGQRPPPPSIQESCNERSSRMALPENPRRCHRGEKQMAGYDRAEGRDAEGRFFHVQLAHAPEVRR